MFFFPFFFATVIFVQFNFQVICFVFFYFCFSFSLFGHSCCLFLSLGFLINNTFNVYYFICLIFIYLCCEFILHDLKLSTICCLIIFLFLPFFICLPYCLHFLSICLCLCLCLCLCNMVIWLFGLVCILKIVVFAGRVTGHGRAHPFIPFINWCICI